MVVPLNILPIPFKNYILIFHVIQKGESILCEIMGRDSGWLTAGSKLACLNQAGPDLIYLPEVAFDEKSFLKKVQQLYQKQQQVSHLCFERH